MRRTLAALVVIVLAAACEPGASSSTVPSAAPRTPPPATVESPVRGTTPSAPATQSSTTQVPAASPGSDATATSQTEQTVTPATAVPTVVVPTPTPTATSEPTPTAGVEVASTPAATESPVATATPEPTPEPTPTPAPTPEVVATAQPAPPSGLGIDVQVVATGFDRPIYVGHAGDASGRLFVVEKRGRILVVQNGQVRNDPFLDITDRVRSDAYEQGLFSVAFHPGYPTNGRIFVDYTDHNGDTVVSEFAADPGQARADPQSERVLLQIEQPYQNHNGGMIAFGPRDGYLYISAGDGGSGGDPLQHGQNPGTLLGSLLRIDVNAESGYAIPVDNPFASQPGKRAEIFAYGLRNVWRFSFDRVTGDLWMADVGQNDLEEVHLALAPLRGGLNYGWNIMEGSACFPPVLSECATEGLQIPVAEYGRDFGCSITGGYVYRGHVFPALAGAYIFGDYCSGRVWTLHLDDQGAWQMVQRADFDFLIPTFGEGGDGELYVTDDNGGRLLRLVAVNEPPSG